MRAVAILLFLVLFGCVTSPETGPIETSISEIQKDPWAWDGKTVRVRGTFDECASYSCNLCETENDLIEYNDFVRHVTLISEDYDTSLIACMGVSFGYESRARGDHTSEKDYLKDDPIPAGLYDQLVRFSTSILIARYDASCSGVQQTADIIVLCTDRASQLREARMERTFVRRPNPDGTINQYGAELLARPDAETTSLIRAAYVRSKSVFGQNTTEHDLNKPIFVYLDPLLSAIAIEDGVEAIGGACECSARHCGDGDWPKRSGDAWIENPVNPYTCWQAERVAGVWRFPLQ